MGTLIIAPIALKVIIVDNSLVLKYNLSSLFS